MQLQTLSDGYKEDALKWQELSVKHNYGFQFSWLGNKIYQVPEDIITFQEVVWRVKPDLIIETGIAEGGSLILSASLLALLDLQSPKKRMVLGIDVDIGLMRTASLRLHPLSKYISTIKGDSVSQRVINLVQDYVSEHKKILVCLDSDHSHNHVLAELKAYAPFVSKESYCIVFDTTVEDLPDELFSGATCGKGNNPRTAVNEYLKTHPEFEIDSELEQDLVFTCARGGWLKRNH